MKDKTWQEKFRELVKSITDDKDPDFVRCLLDEGLESEERAIELTKFINENKINCKNCFDVEDRQRHFDYEKLLQKITENWEVVDEIGYL